MKEKEITAVANSDIGNGQAVKREGNGVSALSIEAGTSSNDVIKQYSGLNGYGETPEMEAERREAEAAAFAEACDHLFYTLRKPQDYMTSIAFEAQKESFRLAIAGVFRAVAAARELP